MFAMADDLLQAKLRELDNELEVPIVSALWSRDLLIIVSHV